MESITYLKNLDITPKKLRIMLPSVKKMSPLEAANVLFYSPKKPGQVFYKAIKSAIANAKQTLKVNDDLLQFKVFTIEEGNKLKRYQAGSRGSAKPFKKRLSHIKIVLTAKEVASPVKPVKATKVVAANQTTKKIETTAESNVKVEPKEKVVKKVAVKKKTAVKVKVEKK